jgi:hypothetical protein
MPSTTGALDLARRPGLHPSTRKENRHAWGATLLVLWGHPVIITCPSSTWRPGRIRAPACCASLISFGWRRTTSHPGRQRSEGSSTNFRRLSKPRTSEGTDSVEQWFSELESHVATVQREFISRIGAEVPSETPRKVALRRSEQMAIAQFIVTLGQRHPDEVEAASNRWTEYLLELSYAPGRRHH